MDISLERPGYFRSSATRPGPLALLAEAARDIWGRRHLIRYLVGADLKKHGADTLFGNIWWVLDPLLQMIVYVILVTVIFNSKTPDAPLFIFGAILPWKWFASSVGDAVASVSGQDQLIKQVKFPKLVLPVAADIAGIFQFLFGLVPLALMLLIAYPHRLTPYIVLIPVVAAVQFLFTLGVSFVFAASNVFFRDVSNVMRHVLRLWFYLSPALYSEQTIGSLLTNHHVIGMFLRLNPFFAILESYRDVNYIGRAPDWAGLGLVVAESLLLLVVATWFFKRLEPAFAKVL
jgi:ABC-type polysaccharide/polyol phosphate export permease